VYIHYVGEVDIFHTRETKFIPLYNYNSAKIIKIDRDFPKLWSQMYCHLFMVHSVVRGVPQVIHHRPHQIQTVCQRLTNVYMTWHCTTVLCTPVAEEPERYSSAPIWRMAVVSCRRRGSDRQRSEDVRSPVLRYPHGTLQRGLAQRHCSIPKYFSETAKNFSSFFLLRTLAHPERWTALNINFHFYTYFNYSSLHRRIDWRMNSIAGGRP